MLFKFNVGGPGYARRASNLAVKFEPLSSNLDYIPAFSSIHFRYSMMSLISWSLMC